MRSEIKTATLTVALAATLLAQSPKPVLQGFSPPASESERRSEARFLALVHPQTMEREHARITAEPHPAGSLADHRNAEYVAGVLRSAGFVTEIQELKFPLSEPGEIKVDLLSPRRWSGPSREFVSGDPASNDPRVSVGFNAYSASGDITAKVVYANYGLPDDYFWLEKHGVSVRGKIVITRYGNCYRGVKAQLAEENGAAGLIIYSDPQDDGYHAGDVYPVGPWRPASAVQRGSVLYDYIYPGIDPKIRNTPGIPVVPLSYGDATHILIQLKGIAAPKEWQGGLPFTYHIGPGPAEVRMSVRMKTVTRTVWNVVGKMRGTQTPEELVIAGNHRDAWVYAAVDPSSGTVVMLETARALGALAASGWRPRRSILLCSWDAEEPDEFGSTAWAETHREEITQKAVAYLNLDSAVAGANFEAAGVPSLKGFMLEVASDIPDPKGGSILEAANRERQEAETSKISGSQLIAPAGRAGTVEVTDLGGGTDYVAFLDHFGIPSTDFTFDGPYGVYHSAFDDHRWMKMFGDPSFAYHAAAARFLGLQILRLADAELLPLDYEAYGKEVKKYLQQLQEVLRQAGKSDRFNLTPAENAADDLAQSGSEMKSKCENTLRSGSAIDFYPVNRALVRTESMLLLEDGLPNRPWYRNSIFAPGIHNGYNPTSLPGVREAFDAGDLEGAKQQLEKLAMHLHEASAVLKYAIPSQ